ncbi:hypothetical protein VTN31DRAFT_6786 [Thermomyces dupontii]|uniref:uncharacterized protein n=1 Tax=Talaromyces thermophilus TaxID=28565 RepID=UPI003742A9A5
MPVVGKNQEPTQEWARNPRFPRRSFDLAWKKQESRPPTARLHRQSLLISSEPPLETVPRRTYGVRECTQHVSTTLGRVWHEGTEMLHTTGWSNENVWHFGKPGLPLAAPHEKRRECPSPDT